MTDLLNPERRTTDDSEKVFFSGTLENIGNRKADFVRIIIKLHENAAKGVPPIAIDSAFVDGSKIKYSNGIR